MQTIFWGIYWPKFSCIVNIYQSCLFMVTGVVARLFPTTVLALVSTTGSAHHIYLEVIYHSMSTNLSSQLCTTKCLVKSLCILTYLIQSSILRSRRTTSGVAKLFSQLRNLCSTISSMLCNSNYFPHTQVDFLVFIYQLNFCHHLEFEIVR